MCCAGPPNPWSQNTGGEKGAVHISIPSYMDLCRGPGTMAALSGQRAIAQNVTLLRPWRVLPLALLLLLIRKVSLSCQG